MAAAPPSWLAGPLLLTLALASSAQEWTLPLSARLDLGARRQLARAPLEAELHHLRARVETVPSLLPPGVTKPGPEALQDARWLAWQGTRSQVDGRGLLWETRAATGEVRASVTVGFPTGLGVQSGQTAASLLLELAPGTPGAGQLEVRALLYQPLPPHGDMGWLVMATTSLGDFDTTRILALPGKAVDLRLQALELGDALRLQAFARPTSFGTPAGAPWQEVSSQTVPGASGSTFRLGLGASGLRKGGRIHVDRLELEGPGVGGVSERPLMDRIAQAAASYAVARGALLVALEEGGAEGGLEEVGAFVQAGSLALEDPLDDVQQALAQGSLQASTQGKRALSALRRCRQQAGAALALLAVGEPTHGPEAIARLDRALEQALVAIANLAGQRVRRLAQVPLAHGAF